MGFGKENEAPDLRQAGAPSVSAYNARSGSFSRRCRKREMGQALV